MFPHYDKRHNTNHFIDKGINCSRWRGTTRKQCFIVFSLDIMLLLQYQTPPPIQPILREHTGSSSSLPPVHTDWDRTEQWGRNTKSTVFCNNNIMSPNVPSKLQREVVYNKDSRDYMHSVRWNRMNRTLSCWPEIWYIWIWYLVNDRIAVPNGFPVPFGRQSILMPVLNITDY